MEDLKILASDEQLNDELNRDWGSLWLRLMGRCAWILRKRYGVNWPNSELKDFSREVISEVINKIFIEKVRKWNIRRYPDFEDFIIGVIDSHINNKLNESAVEVDLEDNYVVSAQETDSNTVEQNIITRELREQIFEELQTLGATDNEILIFECLADGITKPDDIRKSLALSEEDFHNSWRRFKRKREVIKKNLDGYGS